MITLYWKCQKEAGSNELLNQITEQIPNPVLVSNEAGWVIGANGAVMRLTGWSFQELTTGRMTVFRHNSPIDDWYNLGGDEGHGLEVCLEKQDGMRLKLPIESVFTYRPPGQAVVAILREFSPQQEEYVQNLLTKYIIRAQEDERKRVSRELHDELGQNIYSVLVGLQVLEKAMPEAVQIQNLQQMVARSLAMLKNIAVELRPSTLDDLGLAAAIRSFLKHFEQTYGIEGQLTVSGEQHRYEPEIETALYRICQEAMLNVAKYAKVTEVQVFLQNYPDQLNLIVEDQGVGFDVGQLEIQGTGLGLYGMKERAQLVGGKVEIVSQVNLGTRVQATIPLTEKGGIWHAH
ncbi:MULTISPECIES: ATP-binding protein [Desulfitobacterium]|uniref:Oxygen sensor histidine kinase NreB n=2 Tax=Desulfitobacterium hafniense TaxID=49338 RepID=A0A0W1JHS7_DESHA|nr:ATPase/histidine kinase/DNA gyrase B/HSP90 domain protein [Desulfitobacterium hafniense DP7]KTE91562.1 histidine kinase [Desulfitobacterium hafniense]